MAHVLDMNSMVQKLDGARMHAILVGEHGETNTHRGYCCCCKYSTNTHNQMKEKNVHRIYH